MFFNQVPEDLSVINQAIEKGDFSTIKRFAHRMKSTVSMMGAIWNNPAQLKSISS